MTARFKTYSLLFAVIALLGIFCASCRTHERCPAYGKAKVAQKTYKQI